MDSSNGAGHPHTLTPSFISRFLGIFPEYSLPGLFVKKRREKKKERGRKRYVEGRKYLILQHIYSGTKKNA